MACGGRTVDICPARDMAQPHIFEEGHCVFCYTPIDSGRRERKPEWGSQEWAETRGDDIPPLDEPGDDFDSELVITQDHTYDEDEEKEDYGWGI